jgi:hypothetical protein
VHHETSLITIIAVGLTLAIVLALVVLPALAGRSAGQPTPEVTTSAACGRRSAS